MSCSSCTSCSCKKTALTVAGLVFLVAALVNILRLLHPFAIIVNGYTVPQEGSIIAAILWGILALWMFWSSCKWCKCHSSDVSCKK